jgi:hypothetical protein
MLGHGSPDVHVERKHCGKCLDVQNGSTSTSAHVMKNTCDTSSSQQSSLGSTSNPTLPPGEGILEAEGR